MLGITYNSIALRALKRMPANEARRIRGKIAAYAMDPKSMAANVTKLQGREGYRLRVGNWRVLFDLDGNVMAIVDIGPRGSVYLERHMNNVQFIKDASGERLAVIPESDFKALAQAAEDLADIAAYDTAKQALAAGEAVMVPAEYANRILDGENPIRVWREFRKLTAKKLAQSASISQAYLSEIETGKKEGSVLTLKAIADSLGVTLDDLV